MTTHVEGMSEYCVELIKLMEHVHSYTILSEWVYFMFIISCLLGTIMLTGC